MTRSSAARTKSVETICFVIDLMVVMLFVLNVLDLWSLDCMASCCHSQASLLGKEVPVSMRFPGGINDDQSVILRRICRWLNLRNLAPVIDFNLLIDCYFCRLAFFPVAVAVDLVAGSDPQLVAADVAVFF